MNERYIISSLFKTEYSKMVSVLTKSFGLDHIQIAEDIVSETFLTAVDSWPYKGTPANPTAWLYTVAKNKLKNQLQRNATFNRIASKQLFDEHSLNENVIDFSDKTFLIASFKCFLRYVTPLFQQKPKFVCL